MRAPFSVLLHSIFALGLSLLLFGCGGSGSSTTTVATTTVTGTVMAGPPLGATVTVKTTTGTIVAGPVSTASDGSYSIAIPITALTSDLIIEATGGTFNDEADQTATGTGVTMGTLSAHILAGSIIAGTQISLDPSSTIIRKLIAGGMTGAAAEAAFTTAFGYTPDCSIKPAFAIVSSAASSTQRLAGLRAAAFSQLTKDLGLAPDKQFDLVQALADDLSDGILNGKKAGVAVSVSGTALPADIAGRFARAFASFLTGSLNKSKLTSASYNTVFLTPAYKVEYIPGMMVATAGKTTFKIKLTNRSDNTPATGKTITLMPKMTMPTMSHATPADPVVESSTPGTYDCTAYYLMASGPAMGYWELKATVDGESAYFYPSVGMTMGSATARTTLKGIADTYPGMMGAAKRNYYLFADGLSNASGSYTFKLFIAATDDAMAMSYPAVSVGSTLHDASNAAYSVAAMTVEASTDNGTTWSTATQGTGTGHWTIAGLTGLTAGTTGTIKVRLTVNGEQKTTDGNAAGATNGVASFTALP